jgi:hypothetical protein
MGDVNAGALVGNLALRATNPEDGACVIKDGTIPPIILNRNEYD